MLHARWLAPGRSAAARARAPDTLGVGADLAPTSWLDADVRARARAGALDPDVGLGRVGGERERHPLAGREHEIGREVGREVVMGDQMVAQAVGDERDQPLRDADRQPGAARHRRMHLLASAETIHRATERGLADLDLVVRHQGGDGSLAALGGDGVDHLVAEIGPPGDRHLMVLSRGGNDLDQILVGQHGRELEHRSGDLDHVLGEAQRHVMRHLRQRFQLFGQCGAHPDRGIAHHGAEDLLGEGALAGQQVRLREGYGHLGRGDDPVLLRRVLQQAGHVGRRQNHALAAHRVLRIGRPQTKI